MTTPLVIRGYLWLSNVYQSFQRFTLTSSNLVYYIYNFKLVLAAFYAMMGFLPHRQKISPITFTDDKAS